MTQNPEQHQPSPSRDVQRGERLKRLRGDETQPVIAERAGVTLRAYQAWEAGAGIGKSNRANLAQALRTTVSYIMDGVDITLEHDDPSDLVDRFSRQQEILRRVASNRLLTAGQLEYLEQALDRLERGQPAERAVLGEGKEEVA